MTYCAPHDPTWILEADKLGIDPNSGDARLGGNPQGSGRPHFLSALDSLPGGLSKEERPALSRHR